ncbi:MAG: tripartite tricarboxylate transporter substrate binding protein [Pseudomonadota bacterium]
MNSDTTLATRRSALLYAAGLAMATVQGTANARALPTGPVQLVVPFTPGSASDVVARVFGQSLSDVINQPVFVINRPGAGGTIAANSVAKAAPDGRTLAVVGMGHLANPALYKSLPYDTLKDFAPISPLATFPNVLIVPADSGMTTAKQLVDAAKARPGALNYGTAGIGSAAHINMQMLIASTGISLTHIPLKGAGDIVTEVAAGRCQCGWAPLGAAIGMVKSGRISALAISSNVRSPLLHDVPTIREAGFPGAECNVWLGLLAPAKTPAEMVLALGEEVRMISAQPKVREKLITACAEPLALSPAEFDRLIHADYAVLDRLMRNAS